MVAEISEYQPHQGSNHLLSVKSAKIEEKSSSFLKLYYIV